VGKMCCVCGQVLPLESFNRDKGKKDGRGAQCRKCKNIIDAEYRRNNKEAIARSKAKNYQDNKDRIDKRNKEYYLAHKQETANYQAKYRQDNKKQLSERAAEYYKNNKKQIIERIVEYYQDNKDRVLEYHHEHYQNNKDKYFAHSAKRKALKLNKTPTDANLEEIQLYYEVCVETNEILGGAFFHVDHIQPLSKGGLHHEDNLQILEASLNLQKNAKWPLSDEEQIKYKGVTL